MTTFSAYLDAIASSSQSSSRHRLGWLLSARVQVFLLTLTDAVVIMGALGVSVLANGLWPVAPNTDAEGIVRWAVPLLAGAWLVSLHLFGADQLRHLRAGATEYKRVFFASFGLAAAVGITCYLLEAEFPRGLYVLLFSVGTASLIAARFARRRLMVAIHSRGALLTPVIVAGEGHHVDAVAKVLRREGWLGYRVVGAVSHSGHHTPAGVPVLGGLSDVVTVMDEHAVRTVIFAEGSFATPADFRRMAWQLEERDIQMIVVPALSDVSAQRLAVRPVAGLPLVDVDRPQAIAAARWIKRTFDIVGAGLLLLLASPLLALAALAIKLEDGGPVIFRQERVGLKGTTFKCLKFRSMCVDAEARLAELIARNEGAGPLFKMAHDPRITRIGAFIRRFSIDELPQLWNALRGDMSLVGPRPALATEVAQYDSDTRRRLDVRPGLTGLWQVSGRSNLSWDDSVRLDLYYVDNWSLTQDLMILARTARAVVGSDGAY
nr:sugar transferase [Propionicimonas sp.]